MLRLYLYYLVLLLSLGSGYGQLIDDNKFYTCDRNYPYQYCIINRNDSILTPCRKLNIRPLIFNSFNKVNDISDLKNKPLQLLTYKEKREIIYYVWSKKDYKLLPIIKNIVISDTLQEQLYNRRLGIMCLGSFDSSHVKDELVEILSSKDKETAMISALALVQIGVTDIGFDYISRNYILYPNINQVITSLILINTSESVNLLKNIVHEENSIAEAIDACVALSLLGYCKFAYKNIVKYIGSEKPMVRIMVAWCLAYYIGTKEAADIIKSLVDDSDSMVRMHISNICKIYKI